MNQEFLQKTVKGALVRLESEDPMYRGLSTVVLKHANGVSAPMTMEMLLYIAGDAELRGDTIKSNSLLMTAVQIEMASVKKPPIIN